MCKGASKINQHLNVRDKRQGSATQKTTSPSSPLTTDQSTNTAVDMRAFLSMLPSHSPLSSTHTSCAPTCAPALPLFAMCVSVEYGKYIKVDRANSDSLPTALLYSAVLPASLCPHSHTVAPLHIPPSTSLCCAVSCVAHHCPRFSCSAQKMQREKREKKKRFLAAQSEAFKF